MLSNENLLKLGGAVWRTELASLKPFLRQLFYVYGVFIVLTIVGMRLISIAFASEIASSAGLGRAFAAFVLLFWGLRLVVQFFYFDAGPILTTRIMRVAYHLLTLAFILLVCIYGAVVVRVGS